MEKLKSLWNKFRVWIGLLIAAVFVSFLVFKKYFGEGLLEHQEQVKKEQEAKQEAQKKLQEETEKLQKEKEEQLKSAEEEKKKKLKEIVTKAKEEREKLKDLEKRDPQGFKVEVERQLGVKEKKGKGKRRKND